MSYAAGFRAGRAEVVEGWQGMVNELWAALGREPGTDAELVAAVFDLAKSTMPVPRKPDPLPQETRCGTCAEPIVPSRSENGTVTWCHAEVPTTGHRALPAPPRTCSPGCRWCEASERIYAAARVVEETGRAIMADQLLELAELAGRKDPLGTRLARALTGAPEDGHG